MLSQQLKALADDNRLRILACLKQGECCVCDFIDVLNVSQPAVSQHLKKLKDAAIITERVAGKWKYYEIASPMSPIVASVMGELTPITFRKGTCTN